MEDKPEIVDLKRNMVRLKSEVLDEIAANLQCDISEIDTTGLKVFRIAEGVRFPIGELKLSFEPCDNFVENNMIVTMQFEPYDRTRNV